MLIAALLIAAQPTPAAPMPLPSCRAAQLRVSLNGRDGDFNGMSHSGTELSIRNLGADCRLPALPKVEFRDRRGRLLAAMRQAPLGMHPGPVIVPVRLGGGHRAASDLRWVSGPVFPHSRSLHAASVTVRLGAAVLRTPLKAVLYGQSGRAATFEQTPLRAVEGMAAG